MTREQEKKLTEQPVDQWPILNQALYYWLVLTNSSARRGFFSSADLYETPDAVSLGRYYEEAANFKLADLWRPNRSKSD